ncbi:MAG: ABC transporter ATP-binding protein [Lentisphaerae bacterium]|nr:ABC transporter ATP-binding protein [Lentisphaerota bacterium]
MIEIRGLNKRFGRTHAVRDLDLSVPRGELFCLLGPNGAGKTTTMKILVGLLRPTSGCALIGGHDIQREPEAVKRLIGYIPDMPYLYDRLTPGEFFEFIGDLYDLPRDEVRRAMRETFALFGLLDYRSALIKELSHGMKQRLIYACTFLHDPRVLFIDEPLVGLDPHTIRLIKDMLLRKARDGVTIMLTTHILSLAEDVADRIGIVSRGRLIALGTLSELSVRAGGKRNLEESFLHLTAEDEKSAAGGEPRA